MASSKLCGEPTDNGPCTMQKGHTATWHRHRTYNKTYWRITVAGRVINNGEGRVPLQYATTEALDQYDKVVIELERG